MAVADIIITPCKIYYATPGATLPADTVGYAGAWPAGWTALGYTTAPLSVDYKRTPVEVDIQESLVKIKKAVKEESIALETTLAELLTSELTLAWGGTLSVTPASTGVTGKDELVGGDQTALTEYEWGFEGSYVSAAGNVHPIRLYVWKGVAQLGGKLEFGKEKESGIPLHIEANPDLSKTAGQRLFKLVKITAPAT